MTISRYPFAALALVVALAVVACGRIGTPPSPTPADFGGIATRLGQRGIVVRDIVSGDPGCTDRNLAPTAISFTASGLDQPSPVRVYVYIFRDEEVFARQRSAVDACARSYISDPSGYASIDVSPYVAAGQGPWGPSFEAAVRAGLDDAATKGG